MRSRGQRDTRRIRDRPYETFGRLGSGRGRVLFGRRADRLVSSVRDMGGGQGRRSGLPRRDVFARREDPALRDGGDARPVYQDNRLPYDDRPRRGERISRRPRGRMVRGRPRVSQNDGSAERRRGGKIQPVRHRDARRSGYALHSVLRYDGGRTVRGTSRHGPARDGDGSRRRIKRGVYRNVVFADRTRRARYRLR